LARIAFATMMAFAVILPQTNVEVDAGTGGDRTLYLHHTHTGETGRFTFRHNGQYDPAVLAKLNYFLRDWRTNQPTTMSPELFDLIWTVYEKVGATQPINIVSAYRSPATNAYLRSRSSGVAEHSQHMLGHAMDVFIPGVSLVKLRATAMQQQVGGVGFYPTSGSPFVHMDVGGVRAWPRMTRAQLETVFPDGRTLHLPTDGKPLSVSGRQYAMNQWKTCHTVPCDNGVLTGGPINGSNEIQLASLSQKPTDMTPAPTERAVHTVSVQAPVPMQRPSDLADDTQVASVEPDSIPFQTTGSAPLDESTAAADPAAPVPAQKSARMMIATRTDLPANSGQTAVSAIAQLEAPIPASRVQMSKPAADNLVTAYAPTAQEPGAERALQMIIARANAAAPPSDTMETASIGRPEGQQFNGLVDSTWTAVGNAGAQSKVANAVQSLAAARSGRQVELVAPDIDHVTETFVEPVAMSSKEYGVMFEPDEADFNPATELGPLVTKLRFDQNPRAMLSSTRFNNNTPLVVASR
jgi:uncharacterized protein YcbK (DUF882 family)